MHTLVAGGLVVAGGALGLVSDGMRTTPRVPPGPASLLGGFSALAVQVLTMRAADSAQRGDPAAALLDYDLVMELEPQLVDGADWIASEIGAAMAGDEPDPEARWGLLLEGLHVHDRCVATNPGVARALLHRGTYVLLRFTMEPNRRRRFREEFERAPFQAALDDLSTALELDPDSFMALDLAGVAAVHSGCELFCAGDEDAARARLTEAEAALSGALDAYRAQGTEVASKERALAYCRAFLQVLAAHGAERRALYRALYERFQGMPGLPPPDAVPEAE